MIPRIFHRVWVGGNPVPEEFLSYGESWQRHHPGWDLRQWTDDNLPDLLRPEGADPNRDPTERSDLLRYELVRRFGGVYLDMDFECLKPIDELIAGVDFFVGYIVTEHRDGKVRSQRVGSAIIGAVPEHPILERAIREAQPMPDLGYDKEATGPLFLERLLQDFPEATKFPLEYLYPQTEEQNKDAYAIHHEARAWRSHAELNELVKSQYQQMRELRRRMREKKSELQEVKSRLETSERRRAELKQELAEARAGWAGQVRTTMTRLRARGQRSSS